MTETQRMSYPRIFYITFRFVLRRRRQPGTGLVKDGRVWRIRMQKAFYSSDGVRGYSEREKTLRSEKLLDNKVQDKNNGYDRNSKNVISAYILYNFSLRSAPKTAALCLLNLYGNAVTELCTVRKIRREGYVVVAE